MNTTIFSNAVLNTRKLASKAIATQNRIPNNVRFAFDAIMQVICKREWYGACHATAAMLFMVLESEGYKPHLHLGQCKADKFFDHSWVTLAGEIYDAAIAFDLADKQYVGPTFAGFDLDTKQKTTMLYGNSELPFDDITITPATVSLTAYMDGNEVMWSILQSVYERVGIPYKKDALWEKYSTVKREIEPPIWTVSDLEVR